MRILLFILTFINCAIAAAHAQTIGATFDLAGVNQPLPVTGQYQPFLPHNIRTNNLPGGTTGSAIANSASDVAYIATRDGWVLFSGQVWVILDYSLPPPGNGFAVLRIFKNGPPGVCGDNGGIPFAAGIGENGGTFWWNYSVPLSAADYARSGDSYSFCIYVVANGPDSYADGNQAHTRITVTQIP